MKIQFLGAARTVTGSCFYLRTPELGMLVDCGMSQGENADTLNRNPFAFNPADIDYLFITHAHIDHIGLVPKLAREGFKGKILATPATTDLARLMLLDSAHIQETDSAWQTKKALRAGREPILPVYTTADVKAALSLFEKVPYNKLMHTGKGIKYRFLDAGHILGSSSLELWFHDGSVEKKIVFSGDIGRKGNPVINDPSLITDADYIVMESTYGNRLHRDMSKTIDELVEAIKVTFKRKGNVVIPSFAVGRTQDLLYVLNQLVREKRLYKVNVYIDSPLAEEATKTYLSHPECFDEEAKRLLNAGLSEDAINLRFTHSVEESRALNSIKSQAIIIAGSGMCDGGRIKHHLKHNLWRPECSIIFTGFQAKGTLGRRIVDGADAVHFLGEDIAVKANIYTLGGFSAHADQKGLLEWIAAYRKCSQVFVVHGEEQTSLAFADIIRERYACVATVPHRGEAYELS